MNQRIYLDAQAATPIDPRVMKLYIGLCSELWGNASSIHSEGRAARGLLLEAKQKIRNALQIPKRYDILFFSTATEALNTLIFGWTAARPGGSIFSTELEHAAVFEPLQRLRRSNTAQISFVPVGLSGRPLLSDVQQRIDSSRHADSLALFMAANNETGVITEDLSSIAQFCLNRSIPLVVDAVALLGKEELVWHEGISACVFSGHKIHSPKGIAVAVVDRSFQFEPLIIGGPQELKKRAGTESAPLAMAMAHAVEIAISELAQTKSLLKRLQSRFESELLAEFPDSMIHGSAAARRLASVTNIAFRGVLGEELLISLDLAGIAASHGSACASGALEPSRVLLKMGVPYDLAHSSIRFSWSRMTTEEEIVRALSRIIPIVRQHKQK